MRVEYVDDVTTGAQAIERARAVAARLRSYRTESKAVPDRSSNETIPDKPATAVRPRPTVQPVQRVAKLPKPGPLPQIVRKPGAKKIPVIMAIAARKFGTTIEELQSADRSHARTRWRQITMWACRELGKNELSYPDIGREMHRDHTTVIHGAQRISQLMQTDASIEDACAGLLAECRAVLSDALISTTP